MKNTRAGLHLWKVEVKGQSASLWVTTKTKNVQRAIDRTSSALRHNGWPKSSEIEFVKYHGTLDA